jgi:DNA-binding NarL/FixJ family response regulator
MTSKIKLILADSQLLFRESLRVLLRENPQLDVIAEAGNGRSLLDILKNIEVDIVLLENEMPLTDCTAILQIIAHRHPHVKVIVLSNNYREELLTNFIMNGASCYLSKNCDVDTLHRAIEAVSNEGYYIDNVTYKVMLDNIVREKFVAAPITVTEFNDKEINIMREICEGKTNKEIATQLNISPSTVDFYKSKIYSKSKCNNVTGLLRFALKSGFVTL